MDPHFGCSHPPKGWVEDEHGGETVCGGCGTVVSERNEAAGTGHMMTGEDGSSKSQTKALKTYDTNTTIGHPDEKQSGAVYRMRVANTRSVPRRNARVWDMSSRFKRMGEGLGVPDYVADTATNLFEKVARRDRDLVKGNPNKGNKSHWKSIGCVMRGSAAQTTASGIFYAALKFHGIGRSMGELSSASGVGEKELYKAYKKVYHGLDIEGRVNENAEELGSHKPYINASKITRALRLPEKRAAAVSSHILGKYDALPFDLRGGDPATKIGALFVLARKYDAKSFGDLSVSKDGISNILGITSASVRINEARMEGFVRELYRSEGVDVDRIPLGRVGKAGRPKEDRHRRRERPPGKTVYSAREPPVREETRKTGYAPREPVPKAEPRKKAGRYEALMSEVDRIVSEAGLADDVRQAAHSVYGMFAGDLGCLSYMDYRLAAASVVYAGCKIALGDGASIKDFSRKVGIGPSRIFSMYKKVYQSKPEIEELVKGRMGK